MRKSRPTTGTMAFWPIRNCWGLCWWRRSSRCSRREHFLQHVKHCGRGFRIEPSKSFEESYLVHGAKLVENNAALLALESTRQPKRRWLALGRHRGDDDGLQVMVQFVRRNDN